MVHLSRRQRWFDPPINVVAETFEDWNYDSVLLIVHLTQDSQYEAADFIHRNLLLKLPRQNFFQRPIRRHGIPWELFSFFIHSGSYPRSATAYVHQLHDDERISGERTLADQAHQLESPQGPVYHQKSIEGCRAISEKQREDHITQGSVSSSFPYSTRCAMPHYPLLTDRHKDWTSVLYQLGITVIDHIHWICSVFRREEDAMTLFAQLSSRTTSIEPVRPDTMKGTLFYMDEFSSLYESTGSPANRCCVFSFTANDHRRSVNVGLNDSWHFILNFTIYTKTSKTDNSVEQTIERLLTYHIYKPISTMRISRQQ
ncbi:hypothetical protein PROFUN_08835 [Planoprotostelium fungivorum]|uniref:Uncharacterized protein n=1 Tax=Planoprotostelium fungivorum TaxID=1890364 RepID=A0A2P6NIV6_9EUKA|nr:hypothetical protein PROFUN_08835 [Planoprotostelium fungivorum]